MYFGRIPLLPFLAPLSVPLVSVVFQNSPFKKTEIPHMEKSVLSLSLEQDGAQLPER